MIQTKEARRKYGKNQLMAMEDFSDITLCQIATMIRRRSLHQDGEMNQKPLNHLGRKKILVMMTMMKAGNLSQSSTMSTETGRMNGNNGNHPRKEKQRMRKMNSKGPLNLLGHWN
ncbi:ORFX protein [Cacao swollen shoot Ghana L virus]|uniref:ORFX protein n=1 Tax=Cacao swollen shoot Ghana L virus TaxID=2056882 RepID=UPI000CA1ADFC|nr:ORFX protein [Cacao swollen shoot Ghana L virus]ATZ69478.1 ORFX protein [Cacao swollen shoot Ghana L virus]